jgi:hypothetical protein
VSSIFTDEDLMHEDKYTGDDDDDDAHGDDDSVLDDWTLPSVAAKDGGKGKAKVGSRSRDPSTKAASSSTTAKRDSSPMPVTTSAVKVSPIAATKGSVEPKPAIRSGGGKLRNLQRRVSFSDDKLKKVAPAGRTAHEPSAGEGRAADKNSGGAAAAQVRKEKEKEKDKNPEDEDEEGGAGNDWGTHMDLDGPVVREDAKLRTETTTMTKRDLSPPPTSSSAAAAAAAARTVQRNLATGPVEATVVIDDDDGDDDDDFFKPKEKGEKEKEKRKSFAPTEHPARRNDGRARRVVALAVFVLSRPRFALPRVGDRQGRAGARSPAQAAHAVTCIDPACADQAVHCVFVLVVRNHRSYVLFVDSASRGKGCGEGRSARGRKGKGEGKDGRGS